MLCHCFHLLTWELKAKTGSASFHAEVKVLLASATLIGCFKMESRSGDGSYVPKLVCYCFKTGFKVHILQWFKISFWCSNIGIHCKVHEHTVTSQLGIRSEK